MKTINQLAISSIKQNKSRSMLIGITICLTTILLTLLGLCGNAMIKYNLENAGDLNGEYYGTYSGIDKEDLSKIETHAEFHEVGKTAMVATVESSDATITMRYLDDTAIRLAHLTLEKGTMPVKENEIAGQKELFKALGIKNPSLGSRVIVPLRRNGEGQIINKEFVISGLYQSLDLNNLKKTYQAYVSQIYYEKSVPEDDREYTICFQLYNEEKLNYDEMENKIKNLGKEIGISEKDINVNMGYLMWALNPSSQVIAVCVVIGIFVILFSILVIYNIFNIGIIEKIQEYGKIIALGATKKQIKNIILKEGMLLSLGSIPIGLMIGYIGSVLISRYVIDIGMSLQNLKNSKITVFNLPILIFVTLLSLVTVYCSLRKPMKKASMISPIDAIRYQESKKNNQVIRRGFKDMNLIRIVFSNLSSNKKRTATTMLTMGLSCVLFVVVANVVGNMKASVSARDSIEKGDIFIDINYQYNDKTYPENNLNNIQKKKPMGKDFIEKIKNLDGVKRVETRKTLQAKILNMNLTQEEQYCDIQVLNREDFNQKIEDNQRGIMDYDNASKQNGVIYTYNPSFKMGGYKIGQKIEYNIYDGDNRIPFTGTLQASGNQGDATFIMTEDTFNKLNVTEDMTTMVFVYCEKGKEKEIESNINSITVNKGYFNVITYQKELKTSKLAIQLMKSILYALLIIVGMIGFLNMANTLITSIITRRRELGILQAIGMTTKQLNRLLQLEGLIFTIGTLVISLTIGNSLGYLAFLKCKSRGFIGIKLYQIPFLELSFMVFGILLLQIILSAYMSHSLQKESLVERVRLGE